jgi:hypothetical protein
MTLPLSCILEPAPDFGQVASMSAPPAPPIDHAVLPVLDLSTARNGLTKLGFTVAREGYRPFGTAIASEPGCKDVLRAMQVAFERRGNRLIVQPAPGQGARFAFEEEQ